MKKLLALLVAGSAIVACSSAKAPEANQVASAPVEASAPAPAPVVMNHNAVYFAFDKYDIKDEYNGLVSANGNYLAANPQAKVRVEGNTDDIGSVEYNLSLGQRRANAVKKALIAAGANKHQVEATSNGKLKAKYSNDTTENRALNRRSDIGYKADQPAGYSVDSNGLPIVDGSFYNGTITEGVQ